MASPALLDHILVAVLVIVLPFHGASACRRRSTAYYGSMRLLTEAVLLGLLTFSAAGCAEAEPRAEVGSIAREPEIRLHEFRSEVFGSSRMLRVLVPEDYDAPANHDRVYSVLYLNDGQNLFDSSTAVLNAMEWQVDETVHALVASGEIDPLIVVGIDNAGRRGRFKEYFPWVDEYLDPPNPDPQGARYPDFLVNEVLPFIEQRYRVRTDAEGRGLGGSSAGALAALFAAVRRPGVFGRLLIESPSLYVADARVLQEAASLTAWPSRIYLGGGTNEMGSATCDPAVPGDDELVRDLRRLESIALAAGLDSSRVEVVIVPCAVHNECAWADRLPSALRFLFPPNSY